ncbi:unnamed protein product [Linum tenue]|uniref:Gnk2-homologous domain-containing protein n=2 Tax=Linum tenue TaxID=586396 RepID=A0AAV0K2X1_9ROSI|nr:unnamed protein product [Linum tenue]
MGRLVKMSAVFFIIVFGSIHVNNADDDDDDSMSPAESPTPSIKVTPAAGVTCNKTNYTTVYPTDSYVRHVLKELGDEVIKTKGYSKVINFPEIDTPVMSGKGACTKNVSKATCAKCLKDGAKKVLDACPRRVGARFNATACQLRYDVY